MISCQRTQSVTFPRAGWLSDRHTLQRIYGTSWRGIWLKLTEIGVDVWVMTCMDPPSQECMEGKRTNTFIVGGTCENQKPSVLLDNNNSICLNCNPLPKVGRTILFIFINIIRTSTQWYLAVDKTHWENLQKHKWNPGGKSIYGIQKAKV